MSLQVRFGNLNVAQFEKKVEVKFAQADRKWLEDHRVDKASDIPEDKFHIFDMPLGFVCGMGIREELMAILGKKGNDYEARFYVESQIKEAPKEASPDLPF